MRLSWCLLSMVCVSNFAAAQTPSRFVDVTAASGIRLNVEHRPNQPEYGTQCPHGVAVEDFDGDGRMDFLVVCFGKPYVQLFRNLGGMKFADVTRGSGLESFQGWGTGAAVADFDGDGKLDVYLTSVQFEPDKQSATPAGKESRLYKGLGGGKFADVSRESGTLLKQPGRCCAWSDVDGDGWLDLFIACPYSKSVLFRNNGNGTFTDIASTAGVELDGSMSLGCAFGDVDGDGRDDLFVANYDSQPCTLLMNLGNGKFRDRTAEAGLTRKASNVGCVFADVFNRGRLDLFVTTDSWLSGANYTEEQLLSRGNTVEPNMLFVNNGQGRFQPLADKALHHKTLSHDAVLDDLDHDGWLDVYVGVDAIPTGNRFATHKGGNPVWSRTSDGKQWRELRKEWGVGFEANCVCVPSADFDGDGDLDLLLVNFYKNAVLYRNNTDDKRWLVVKPEGSGGNRSAVGAQVRLYQGEGANRRLLATRHIQAGAGYGRSSALEAHFGLGPAAKADRFDVEVLFPATKTKVVKRDLAPGQRVVVKQATDGEGDES